MLQYRSNYTIYVSVIHLRDAQSGDVAQECIMFSALICIDIEPEKPKVSLLTISHTMVRAGFVPNM